MSQTELFDAGSATVNVWPQANPGNPPLLPPGRDFTA